MRVTAGMSQRHVLTDLRRVQERLASAQGQVSGGKRIEKPSDDPLGAERAMRLNAQLDSTTAYQHRGRRVAQLARRHRHGAGLAWTTSSSASAS